MGTRPLTRMTEHSMDPSGPTSKLLLCPSWVVSPFQSGMGAPLDNSGGPQGSV